MTGLIVLTVVFALRYFIFLGGIIRGLMRIRKQIFNEVKREISSVSIVIAFRNEQEHIERCLQSLLKQHFPAKRIEIILINDHSTDAGVEIVENILSNYSGPFSAILLHTPDEISGKKRSLAIAIAKSSGEIIVTTDADCIYPEGWLKGILLPIQAGYDFVAGPVRLFSDNSLFMNMQQMEHAGLVLSAAGLIGNGTPVTCNGANVAFTREIFERVNGYENHKHLSSGDDELLMQEIAYSGLGRVTFCFSPDTLVLTEGVKNPAEFLQQRVRWASKGKRYPMARITLLLVTIFLFFIFFTALSIQGLFHELSMQVAMGMFLVKCILEYISIRLGKGIVFEEIHFPTFLLNEIIHVPYILFSSIFGTFSNFVWKDRKLKQ